MQQAISFSRRLLCYSKPILRTVQKIQTVPSTSRNNSSIISKMSAEDRKLHVLPNSTPVCALDCTEAFAGLGNKEQLYAHHLSKASFIGSLITFLQTSPESPLIHVLVQKLFRAQPIEDLKKVALEKAAFSEEDFKALLVYISGFSANGGNYKGFGDTKIIPDLDEDKMEKLVLNSAAFAAEPTKIQELWDLSRKGIFGLSPNTKKLGLGDKGVTTYLSWNVTQEDSAKVDRWMKEVGMEGWNTRLFKTEKDGKTHFEIRLPSTEKGVVKEEVEFEDAIFKVTRHDYAPILKEVLPQLQKAMENADNEEKKRMLSKYIEHFTTGELDAHKDGSRFWIKDKGPLVESYIGFIENYRDPVGVRSEFEGFVAAVNSEMSQKFARLVANAEELLKRLPWGASYEKDAFLKPDFTSLDVISFGGSGIPAGINIPNYDEIRQSEGFKNVSLGNVISAIPNQKLNFLSAEDEKNFRKYHKDSFEVQVGLHELLGHGSGKLFIKSKDGSFNFDRDATKNLETGGPIESWYEEGETWGTKFGALASAYEECRAEAVGYVLCCFPDVLKIFGFEGEVADEVKYCNWVSEIRAGLMGLEFYSPEDAKWGQAHCYARYVLLRVAMEAGGDFVKIETIEGEDGKPDLKFTLDRTKIDSVGMPATNKFLKLLQHYKSTADEKKGRALFEKYGLPDEMALKWREIVVARRQPRRLFVQPSTQLKSDGGVELKTYPETVEGLVQSYLDRYADVAHVEDEIITLFKNDQHHFKRQ